MFLVPNTSNYSITVSGARGGTHSYNYGFRPGTYYGVKGAKIQGIFHLSKGTVLNVVVGKRGRKSVEIEGRQRTTKTAAELGMSVEDNAGTGGERGSFVYDINNSLLIASGGEAVHPEACMEKMVRLEKMFRLEEMAPVARLHWATIGDMLEKEGSRVIPVSAILKTGIIMAEWVGAGWIKVVHDLEHPTVRLEDHVFRVGWEDWQAG